MNSKIEKAKQFATKMHKGQYRIGGEEYIVHPTRVASYVQKYKESKEKLKTGMVFYLEFQL